MFQSTSHYSAVKVLRYILHISGDQSNKLMCQLRQAYLGSTSTCSCTGAPFSTTEWQIASTTTEEGKARTQLCAQVYVTNSQEKLPVCTQRARHLVGVWAHEGDLRTPLVLASAHQVMAARDFSQSEKVQKSKSYLRVCSSDYGRNPRFQNPKTYRKAYVMRASARFSSAWALGAA
eukprot:6182066-Pleurochrysis_carterae.AAC.2